MMRKETAETTEQQILIIKLDLLFNDESIRFYDISLGVIGIGFSRNPYFVITNSDYFELNDADKTKITEYLNGIHYDVLGFEEDAEKKQLYFRYKWKGENQCLK